MQAVGVHDHWAEVQIVPPSEEELWVQHAVQSIVWRAAGVNFRVVHRSIRYSYII